MLKALWEAIPYISSAIIAFIIIFPKYFYQFVGDRLKEQWRRDTEIALLKIQKTRPQSDAFYQDR